MNEPTKLSYERRGEILWIRFPEYETADELRPLVDAAVRLTEELDATRILIDATASHIALSPIDYRRVGQYVARRPGTSRMSMAIVRRAELVGEARLLEEWLKGQAIRYRVFSDFGEAEAWLREPGG